MYINELLFFHFLTEKEIGWAGIDFSQSKFTKEGFDFTTEKMQRLCHEWNLLIINDQKKYDIRKAFRKPVIHYDLSMVSKLNRMVKSHLSRVERLRLHHQQSDESIRSYVESLPVPALSRYVLMVVVESFDARSCTASLWVVILQTEKNKIVLIEKFLKNPAGFGIKNYWARCFYNLFFEICKLSFSRWQNMSTLPDDLTVH
ncbi:MAG: hypothetical protein LBR51_00405 [Bacteroidales bacterium]|jgi:hypothetical protein|nr:hypothetical protein [Bacteroidales bacterium]